MNSLFISYVLLPCIVFLFVFFTLALFSYFCSALFQHVFKTNHAENLKNNEVIDFGSQSKVIHIGYSKKHYFSVLFLGVIIFFAPIVKLILSQDDQNLVGRFLSIILLILFSVVMFVSIYLILNKKTFSDNYLTKE